MWRHVFLVAGLVGVGVGLVGCKPKEPEGLAVMSGAPTWDGTSPIGQFIVGKWSPGAGMDPETAAAFGVEEGADVDSSQYWEFSADGKFFYTKVGSKDKVHGTWTDTGKGIHMVYEKWNDEPLNEARQRFIREAESGAPAAIVKEQALDWTFQSLLPMNYLEVSEDKKGLVFTSLTAPEPGGSIFDLSGDTPLVRMK